MEKDNEQGKVRLSLKSRKTKKKERGESVWVKGKWEYMNTLMYTLPV